MWGAGGWIVGAALGNVIGTPPARARAVPPTLGLYITTQHCEAAFFPGRDIALNATSRDIGSLPVTLRVLLCISMSHSTRSSRLPRAGGAAPMCIA